MAEPRHTPGPWLYGVERETGDYGNVTFTIVDDHDTPRDIARGETGFVYGPSLANVRLMAAAPDLLAACKAAEAFIGGDGDPMEQAIVTRLLDSAIAKAEGK